jgi:pyruvate-ferredoxin/flavodoxin oxidoreductase
MAHRTSYVLQGAISNVTHLLEGYIDGLNSRRPALFNIYAVCQPEHGVADDASAIQSKLAVESRAYPLFKYDPDAGITFKECCDLDGNPAIESDWPLYQLNYLDEQSREQKLELPMTFADFAMTEGRFRKHFRKAPPETWNDDMMPLHEFLQLDEDDRDGQFPFIWGVDGKQRLMRVLVAKELVRSCEERQGFWQQLRSLAGVDEVVDEQAIANQAKAEMAQKLSASLLALATSGDVAALADIAHPGGGNGEAAAGGGNGAGEWEPVWIETPECTACDECTDINPRIFVYNDDKKAVVIDPKGGPYRDIVKAAEKCTAGCVHP